MDIPATQLSLFRAGKGNINISVLCDIISDSFAAFPRPGSELNSDMSATPLDLETIASIRALAGDSGDDFLREIIGIFLEDTPLRFAEMDEALRAGDASKLARAAHSIKGSSSNVGALTLRTEAEALEQKSHHSLDGAAEALANLRQEFDRTKLALNALLG